MDRAVAAGLLGFIERQIGLPVEFAPGELVSGMANRDPDRDRHLSAVRHRRCAHVAQQAEREGFGQIVGRAQDCEFLAPDPRHAAHQVGPDREPFGDFAQHFVALVVAVAVVDRLEVVDIDQQQPDRTLRAERQRGIEQRAAVEQAGQRIGQRQIAGPALQAEQVDDVGLLLVDHVQLEQRRDAEAHPHREVHPVARGEQQHAHRNEVDRQVEDCADPRARHAIGGRERAQRDDDRVINPLSRRRAQPRCDAPGRTHHRDQAR